MRNLILKSIKEAVLVTVLLLSFLGQAMAYSTMACDMSANSHTSMEHSSQKSMKSMHHDGVDHSNSNASVPASSGDCCDIECLCPVTACTSISILCEIAGLTVINNHSDDIDFHQLEQLNSIPTSLYRPPIFA